MFSVLDIKRNHFTYYEHERLFPGVCDKIYKHAPKTDYKNWLREIRRNALEYSLDFIGFTNETFIQNNVISLFIHRKQPNVLACKTVLDSLNLKKTYKYLVVNAGGNKQLTMPFFKALQLLNKLEYDEFIKHNLTKNIITLGTPVYSRAKYKINYLDYVNSGYSVILGACEKHEFPYYLDKALKEANNYIVFYSNAKVKDSNYVFLTNSDFSFYVYDMQNLGKPTQYEKIKYNNLSSLDKYLHLTEDSVKD